MELSCVFSAAMSHTLSHLVMSHTFSIHLPQAQLLAIQLPEMASTLNNHYTGFQLDWTRLDYRIISIGEMNKPSFTINLVSFVCISSHAVI